MPALLYQRGIIDDQHRVLASVDGQQLPMPINLDTVNRLYGLNLTSFEMQGWLESVAERLDRVETSEDVVVSAVVGAAAAHCIGHGQAVPARRRPWPGPGVSG